MKFFDDLKHKSIANKLKKGQITKDEIVAYALYVSKAIGKNGLEEFEKVDEDIQSYEDFLIAIYSLKPETAKYFPNSVYRFRDVNKQGEKLVTSGEQTYYFIKDFAPEIFKHLPIETARWFVDWTNDKSVRFDSLRDKEGNELMTLKPLLRGIDVETLAEIEDITEQRFVKEVILPSNNPIEVISHDDFAIQAYAKYVAKEIDEKGIEEFEKVDEDVKTYKDFLNEIYKLKPETAKYLTTVYTYNACGQNNSNTLLTSAVDKISLITHSSPEIYKYLPLSTAEWVLDSYKNQPFVNHIEDKEGNILDSFTSYVHVPEKEDMEEILKILAVRKANEIEDDGIADE